MKALLLSILAVQLTPSSNGPPEGWELVYQLNAPDSWLATVWANSAGAWAAGGKDILVNSSGVDVRATLIQGRGVLEISQHARGLFAVGTHGAIWRIDGRGATLEHQTRPTSERRSRDIDTFFSVVDTEEGGAPGLMVLGVNPYFSSTSGQWHPLSPIEGARKRSQSLLYGSAIPKPLGCGPATWLAFSGQTADGVLVCGDKRAFRVIDSATSPLPKLPKSCANVGRAAVGKHDLLIVCGMERLFELTAGDWREITTPFKVESAAATDSCIWAASRREVWRRCKAPSKSTNANSPAPSSARPPAPADKGRGCSFGR